MRGMNVSAPLTSAPASSAETNAPKSPCRLPVSGGSGVTPVFRCVTAAATSSSLEP